MLAQSYKQNEFDEEVDIIISNESNHFVIEIILTQCVFLKIFPSPCKNQIDFPDYRTHVPHPP